jgi:hypothetical protein
MWRRDYRHQTSFEGKAQGRERRSKRRGSSISLLLAERTANEDKETLLVKQGEFEIGAGARSLNSKGLGWFCFNRSGRRRHPGSSSPNARAITKIISGRSTRI